jgi:Protein of unknown function (DUF4239)
MTKSVTLLSGQVLSSPFRPRSKCHFLCFAADDFISRRRGYDASRFRGGDDTSSITAADVEPPTKKHHMIGRLALWSIPFVSAVLSFATFPTVCYAFHFIVVWASKGKWIPENDDHVNLQTNVITQVVNGPVITSVSVLLATLVSTTVSTLHSRQLDVQKSFMNEVQAMRKLKALFECRVAAECLQARDVAELVALVDDHLGTLDGESQLDGWKYSRKDDPHHYIESDLQPFHAWISQFPHALAQNDHKRRRHRSRLDDELQAQQQHQQQFILLQAQKLVERAMEERTNRWLAITAMHFPFVHYLTLSLLALSIIVAFLVATDEAEFIFCGLQVQLLWTVLITSFTALGVVCFDLSNAFVGEYSVSRE